MSKLTAQAREILNRTMREAIRNEVFKLINQDDEDKITMDLIAERLQISKGTLYNYYTNKQELIEDAAVAIHTGLRDQLEEISRTDASPDEKIMAYISLMFENFPNFRSIFSLLYASSRKTPLKDLVRAANVKLIQQEIEKEIANGVEKGIFREYEDPRATAMVVYATAVGMMQTVFFGDTEYCQPDCQAIFRKVVIYSLYVDPRSKFQ